MEPSREVKSKPHSSSPLSDSLNIQIDPNGNGQRRRITVLFTDLSGYTEATSQLDNEDVYELIQQYIRLLVKEVHKYEGTVSKLTGDGLMALFGAPVSYENDEERAVRAALDMQINIANWSKQVKEHLGVQLTMRVGIHAGEAIVGEMGSRAPMDYTAIGDSVNLAHRLEEAAPPGAILVSEEVYQKTKGIFDFEAMCDMRLKGFSQLLTCYRVINLRTAPKVIRRVDGLHAALVGRDEELSLLKQTVSDLIQRKQGRFVWITGEAGIGKSRLVTELVSAVDEGKLNLLKGQTLTYRRLVSYWIFLDLLRNYLGVSSETPEIEVSRKLKEAVTKTLGDQASDRQPYLEYLLSLPLSNPSANDRIRSLEAGQLRQHIFQSVRDLLMAEARQRPTMMILEDLHWADEASLNLIQFILDELHRIPFLVFAISRPTRNNTLGKLTNWVNHNFPEQYLAINLPNLTLDQSRNLVSSLTSNPDLPEEFSKFIAERAEGVPLYMEEILRKLIDEGIIQRHNGRWGITKTVNEDELGVPINIQGLILARFDQLDELSQRVLQVASIIGHHFNLELLVHVMQTIDKETLQQTLSDLVEREFIVCAHESQQGEYTFKHVLMSECIYNTMLKRERNRLHGVVGEAIESLHADRLNEYVELLTRHYSWSSKLDKSLHYLILAGQKAAQTYINEQARKNFREALALLPIVEHTPLQAIQIYSGLGDLSLLSGDYQAAHDYFQSGVSALTEEDREQYLKEYNGLLRKIATTHERQGNFEQALKLLTEALVAIENYKNHLVSTEDQELVVTEREIAHEQAQIYNDIGWVHLRRGDLDKAIKALESAQKLVENSSHYEILSSIYNRLGDVYFQKGQLNLASTNIRKSLVLREEIGENSSVARSYNSLGLLSFRMGDWKSALEYFRRSVNLFSSLGDVEGMIESLSNLGLVKLEQGEIEEAKQYLENALTSAQQTDHAYYPALLQLYLCRLKLATGEWQSALEFSHHCIEIFGNLEMQPLLAEACISYGLACLGKQEMDQAKSWGEKAWKIFQQTGTQQLAVASGGRGRALRLLGDVARLRGDYSTAENVLIESSEIFEKFDHSLEQARTYLSRASLAVERGDQTQARVHLNEARMIFQQLGAKSDLCKLEALAQEISNPQIRKTKSIAAV